MNYRNRIIGLEYVNPKDLQSHPGNWRDHPTAQVEALKGVLAEVGIAGALLAYRSERNGGALTAIDGHLRKDAAPGQAWPVLVLDVSDAEADYILATHDPLAAMAQADAAALDALLQSVNSGEAGVQAMLAELAESAGLYQDEPKDLNDAEPQVDRAEELRAVWKVEPGQLWELGDHRLICGDCTDPAVVERVMGGEIPNLIIADPPYGVSIVASNGYVGGGEGPNGIIPFGGVNGKPFRSKDVRSSDGAANIVNVGKYAPIIGDETTDTALRSSAFYLNQYPKAVQVWWGANYYTDGLRPSPCWLVWDKETTGNFADCELAWVNQDKAAKLFRHQWNGMLRESERQKRWHPTQKPAALAAWVCAEFTQPGAIVLDPFAGAGWSILAGEQTKRKVRAIEMAADYIGVILQRWADATGRTPVLVT